MRRGADGRMRPAGFRRDDCPPAPAAPDTVWTEQGQEGESGAPRVDQGVNALGLPRYQRHEIILIDTALPNAVPPFLVVIANAQVARNETLHVVRIGQRLVVRRPGRLPAPHGDPSDYLSGINLLVQWDLVRANHGAPTGDSARAALALVPDNGSSRIWSPADRPRGTHILVPGPASVIFQARVTGTDNLRDKLFELGGFLETWRYLEGGVPRDFQFVSLTSGR